MRGAFVVCLRFAGASTAGAQQAAPFVELGPAQIRAVLSIKYGTDDFHWAHHCLPDGRLTRVEKGRVKPGESRSASRCIARVTGLQYRDERGCVVWSGSIRNRAGTHLFEGVTDPTPGGIESRAVTAPSPARQGGGASLQRVLGQDAFRVLSIATDRIQVAGATGRRT